MNFVCRKLDCRHNNKFNCEAQKINVDKKLNCDMYEKDTTKNPPDPSKTMFDLVPEMAPYKHNIDCTIECQANCIFNKKNECMSNGILINYTKNSPAICFSHQKT